MIHDQFVKFPDHVRNNPDSVKNLFKNVLNTFGDQLKALEIGEIFPFKFSDHLIFFGIIRDRNGKFIIINLEENDSISIQSPDKVLRNKFGNNFLIWMQESLDTFVKENFEV